MLNSVLAVSRSRIVPFSLALIVGAGLFAGCRKNADQQNADAIRKSLEGFKPQFAEARRRFMDLRERVESVPADLEGFGDVRARYYAAEEARGVSEGRVQSLSDRLEAALKTGDREELQQISADIGHVPDDIRKIDELHTKLLHQIMTFERIARQVQQDKEAAAAAPPSPTPSAVKTSKSKLKSKSN